jgi:hypothetical protein
MLSQDWLTALHSLSRQEKYDAITALLYSLKQDEGLAAEIVDSLTLASSNFDEDDGVELSFEDEGFEDEEDEEAETTLSPEDDKVVSRWLPRLSDHSSEVREKAAENLAQVAIRNTKNRNSLVPLLLDHARTEEDFSVVCDSILYPLSALPRRNRQWTDALLDVYVHLARKADYVTGSHAYGYIWELIEIGLVGKQDPKFPVIMQLAKHGENSSDSDIRAHSLTILEGV